MMNRDDILNAAAHVFSQKGFHAASMQDIAQAVNLQKASLYHHIDSKQEILLALLDQALDMLTEHIQTVIDQPMPITVKLREAMRLYLADMLGNRELASVLLLEYRSLRDEYRARHILRRDRFEGLWRDMIQEGIDIGVFNSTDPGVASRALLGVMNWTITWYHPEGVLNPRQIADQYADLFLSGLLQRQTNDR
jgi:AcrR family transcriptional regulator